MTGFRRDANGRACLGGTPLADLLTEAAAPTPLYMYDLDAIRRAAADLVAGFDGAPQLVAYAVKANSAGSIVRAVASAGAGADVVSEGELRVAIGCGIPPDRIVMSGVAKTDGEIDLAIATRIRALQLESIEEIDRVAARARSARTTVRVSIRVNPGVEIDAHAHVATGHDEAKFGIAREDLPHAWRRIDDLPELDAVGVSTHVGSMLADPAPYLESARVVCDVARRRLAAGRTLDFVDFGGGFGIDYGDGPVQPPAAFARASVGLLEEVGLDGLALVVEPGRALVGPQGVVLCTVVQSKVAGDRRWVMVDAGMNDLLRPALYGAHHRIEPLDRPPDGPSWRVVGPVCESADDFGCHGLGLHPPKRVVIRDAGAYGFSMASEYNGRALAAEAFVEGGRIASTSRSRGSAGWAEDRLSA